MSKQQQLLLLPFLCLLFNCFLYSAQQEKQDKEYLIRNLNVESLQNFLKKYPRYVNKLEDAKEPTFFDKKTNRSLAFFLIIKNRLDLAIIMAQEGDAFNSRIKTSDNPKNIGSTPFIALAFMQSNEVESSKQRSELIQLILKNNPYASYDSRDDGMAPYLAASVNGDIELMNLLEKRSCCYNDFWLAELQRQKTSENLTAIDLLKFSISRAKRSETQEKLFSKLIDISHNLLNQPDTTSDENNVLQTKFKNSIDYLQSYAKTNPSLKRLLNTKADNINSVFAKKSRTT